MRNGAGPNPVDRGKKGSKLYVLSGGPGHPARRRGVRRERSRQPGPQATDPRHTRRPLKLRADKAYFSAEHLTWLRERGPIPRIARPAIESSERLGRHRWKIERSIAWLFGYRRLTVLYVRKGSHCLAAALTCCKKLAKLAT